MPGLVPGIHVFASAESKTWMAGHRRAEATPSFGRLCPAMTEGMVTEWSRFVAPIHQVAQRVYFR